MIDDVIIKINVLFILFNGRRETFADIQAKLGKVIGMGKMMVELCSADIEFRVCRYRSWNIKNISPLIFKYFSSDLQGMWRLLNDLRCLLQSIAGLLFPLSCDHLEKWKDEDFCVTFKKFLNRFLIFQFFSVRPLLAPLEQPQPQ